MPGSKNPAPHITRHSAVLTIPNGKPVTLAGSHEGRLIAGVHSGGTRQVAYHILLERATKLKANELRAPKMKPLSAKPSVNPGPQDAVVEFDVTVRRREKKRGVAAAREFNSSRNRFSRRRTSRLALLRLPRSHEIAKPPVVQQPAPPVRPPVKTAAAPRHSASCLVADRSPSASHSQAKSNGNAAATQGARSHQPPRLSERSWKSF